MCKVWEESVDDERFACDPIRVAVMVESVLFESWGGCYGSQKGRYGTLIFNLKDQKKESSCWRYQGGEAGRHVLSRNGK